MEGGDGYHTPSPQNSHLLSWRAPQIMGRLRYEERLPLCQTASEFNAHEGGGPVLNLSGPAHCL